MGEGARGTSARPRTRRARRLLLLALVVALVATAAAVLLRPEGGERSTPAGWTALDEPGVGGRITSLAISPSDPDRVLVGGDMLGVGLSTDGGRTWGPTYGFEGYEIAEFTWHPTEPGTVWVGTMSGPYVSTDAGHTWSPKRAGFPETSSEHYSAPVERVLVDAEDPDHLLAVGGSQREWPSQGSPAWGAVWESRDGGEQWRRKGTVGEGANVSAVVGLGGGTEVLVAGSREVGVQRSTDGGATWTSANAGLPHTVVADVASHPEQPDVLWAALDSGPAGEVGGVHRSEDGGRTWTPSDRGLNGTEAASEQERSRHPVITVAPSSPDVLYTSDASWTTPSLFRSEDGGRSWSRTSSRRDGEQTLYRNEDSALAIVVSEDDPDRVVVGGDEALSASDDGGASWADVSSRPGPDGGFVGTGYSGLVANDVVLPEEERGSVLLCAMDGGNVVQSTDGGQSWTAPLRSWDPYNGCYSAAASGESRYALLGQSGRFNGLARSTDAGETWDVAVGADKGLPERGSSDGASPVAVHALDERRVLATLGGRLYRSTDAGSSWQVVQEDRGLGALGGDADGDVVYVVGRDGTYRSTDGGETLEELPGGPAADGDAARVAVHPEDDDRVYVTRWRGDGGGLWELDGDDWRQLLDDPEVFDVAVDPTDPRRLAAVALAHPFRDVTRTAGVRVSHDGGRTWEEANEGLPVLRAATVAFDPHSPGRLLVGTEGRGYFTSRVTAS